MGSFSPFHRAAVRLLDPEPATLNGLAQQDLPTIDQSQRLLVALGRLGVLQVHLDDLSHGAGGAVEGQERKENHGAHGRRLPQDLSAEARFFWQHWGHQG